MAVIHVLTMIAENTEHFVYLDNIKTLEDMYKGIFIDKIRNDFPGKTFYISTLVKLKGSEEFFTNLAYLECNKENLDFDSAPMKQTMLKKRFNHPAVLMYHPEVDSFSLSILTHAKKVNDSLTLPLDEIDLEGRKRNQYLVADGIMIPRTILEEFIKKGQLECEFNFKDTDLLNYMREYNVTAEFRQVARDNLENLKLSAPLMNEGKLDVSSPLISKLPLKISRVENTELVTVHYNKTKESFMISKALIKKIEFIKKTSKQGCNCIIF